MRPLCALALMILLVAINASALAWDGDWTQASSGRVGLFDDPDSSQGKAGTDPPQKYYTPNPRDYIDVDPEELGDYFNRYKKEYSPYALTRITQNIHYNNVSIPKGYYLIKPGDASDGSPRVSLKTIDPPVTFNEDGLDGGAPDASAKPALPPLEGEYPAVENEAVYSRKARAAAPESASPQRARPAPQGSPNIKPDEPVYRVFVIKRSGKVIGVVPINRMEVYHPKRKEHAPRHALAWMEMENRHPVLKFYYRKRIYSTDFQ